MYVVGNDGMTGGDWTHHSLHEAFSRTQLIRHVVGILAVRVDEGASVGWSHSLQQLQLVSDGLLDGERATVLWIRLA